MNEQIERMRTRQARHPMPPEYKLIMKDGKPDLGILAGEPIVPLDLRNLEVHPGATATFMIDELAVMNDETKKKYVEFIVESMVYGRGTMTVYRSPDAPTIVEVSK